MRLGRDPLRMLLKCHFLTNRDSFNGGYVDTLLVCTATALMILFTNQYNVLGEALAI